MILVVREKYTERKEFKRCYRQLKMSNVNILGCVLTGIDSADSNYSKYKKYKYYKNSEYHQE